MAEKISHQKQTKEEKKKVLPIYPSHHVLLLIGLCIYLRLRIFKYSVLTYTYTTSMVSVYSIDHPNSWINANVANSFRLQLPEQISGTGQPIPAAFVYTKELYDKRHQKQVFSNNSTNSTMIVMNPEVYVQLTNRIRRIKHARKPLRIMINSHPCAGKSFFKNSNKNYFMGCKLEDHDKLGPGMKRDSSYLLQDNKRVKNNTALLGEMSAHHGSYIDVVYIHVIPPMTIIEQNIVRREKDIVAGRLHKNHHRWAVLGPVTMRRRGALLNAIKEEVLLEPLFATFQEGLEFCINTYNIL